MKTYFSRSAFYLTAAIIIYVLWQLVTKYLIHLSIEDFDDLGNLASYAFFRWLVGVTNYALIVAALIQFMIFMNDCNKNLLFTDRSSHHLMRISFYLLIYAGLSFLSMRILNNGDSLSFAMAVFISSISYSFSRIFRKAAENQKEQDLTI